MQALPFPSHYATADEPASKGPGWIAAQWQIGRDLAAQARERGGALLVLDEVQKVNEWSETVKRLWDEDTHGRLPLRVLLLGSAPLLVQRGLSESLAGRFELMPVTHWSFSEMREAFGCDLDRYIFFGGYPGAASLIEEPARWARHILDSLIETTVARDILLMTRIDKPALLRQLLQLACKYSGQVLSYTKMLGQLHNAGNTTTLAHYLSLLGSAGMATGLHKFTVKDVVHRASSPKLLILNTALMTAPLGTDLPAARRDPAVWGRLVETAVGAHLVNSAIGTRVEALYWREAHHEVDFVLRRGRHVTAIEVKSGRPREDLSGLEAFTARFRPRRTLLVGSGGMPVEQLLEKPAEDWVG